MKFNKNTLHYEDAISLLFSYKKTKMQVKLQDVARQNKIIHYLPYKPNAKIYFLNKKKMFFNLLYFFNLNN